VDASETVGEDSRRYDGGKSRDGRKRHILTDTEGLLLEVTVTTADVHDSKAATACASRSYAAWTGGADLSYWPAGGWWSAR
jgi:hypothetical protein